MKDAIGADDTLEVSVQRDPPKPEIDWSTFDKHPESECGCRCGGVFRSHAKMQGINLVSRKPCPDCGANNNLCRVLFAPESFVIGG